MFDTGAIMPMGAGLQEPVLICCPFVMGSSVQHRTGKHTLSTKAIQRGRTRSGAKVNEVVRRRERRNLPGGRSFLTVLLETSCDDRLEKRCQVYVNTPRYTLYIEMHVLVDD